MNPFDYSTINKIGQDVFIGNNVEIKRPNLVTIGNHVAIDSGFYCTTQLVLGNHIHISAQVTVIGGAKGLLTLKNFVSIGAGSRMICGSDGFVGHGLMGYGVPEELMDEVYIAPILFENFASVGTNVVIMPGITLAEGSVVGACSMLTKDTEPWTIYVGIPAKPIKIRPKEKMIEYAKTMGYL